LGSYSRVTSSAPRTETREGILEREKEIGAKEREKRCIWGERESERERERTKIFELYREEPLGEGQPSLWVQGWGQGMTGRD
jgi:predicted nucleotidyltransferase